MEKLEGFKIDKHRVEYCLIPQHTKDEVSAGMLKQFFKIRHDIWVKEKRWEESKNCMETDVWDNFSTFIIVLFDGEVCGGGRIIDGNSISLPIKKYIGTDIPKNSVELSRVVLVDTIPHKYRVKVLIKFYLMIYDYLKKRNYSCYADMRDGLKRKLAYLGLKTEVVGRTQMRNKHKFTPVKLLFKETETDSYREF